MGSRLNDQGTPVPVGATEPATSLAAVSPHASNALPGGTCRGLWVGAAGDVSIVAESDAAAVTIVGVPAGTLLPIRAKAVRVSGTTATSIVALY